MAPKDLESPFYLGAPEGDPSINLGLVWLDDDDPSRMAWIMRGVGRLLFVEEHPGDGTLGSRSWTYTLDTRESEQRRTFSERELGLKGSRRVIGEWMAELAASERGGAA